MRVSSTVLLVDIREFKQITTAAVTEKGLERVHFGGLPNFKFSKAKYKDVRNKG